MLLRFMRSAREALCLAAFGLALMGLAVLGLASEAGAADKGGARDTPAIAAPAGALSLLPVPDTSAAPTSWSGAYIGAHGGMGAGVTEITQHDTFVRGLSADGLLGGLHLGADLPIPNSIWLVGLRVGYTWSDVEFSAGQKGGPSFSLGIKESWWVDGVVGLGLGSVKPYVFGGWTEAKLDTNATGLDLPDLRGWRAGTGIEWKIPGAQFVTLGFDYAYTRYEDVSVGEYCPIGFEPEDHRVMATVSLRFGGK